MRVLDPGLAAHLAGGATTLATCWKIVRRDAIVLGFTDHDVTLSFAGIDYLPAHGLDGGEVPRKLGAGVDTAEVVGVLTSAAISEDDIMLGRYDGAVVETWRVNWHEPAQRHLVSRATIGEIVREDGAFRAELRSGQHALNQVRGRHYTALCDATVGDARCGIDLEADAHRAEAVVVAIRDRFRIAVSGLEAQAAGWFALGSATWLTGRRIGLVDRIVNQRRDAEVDVLAFATPVGEWVAAGDTLVVRAGCDGRFTTCRSKFANGVNFRGFPHIPGSDFVLRYPRRGDALDGRALVE